MIKTPSIKVFQIGFNRCGSTTLYRFFRDSGVPSIHWDKGMLACRLLTNILNGRPPLLGYQEFTAFFDMELIWGDLHVEVFKSFPILYAAYPDAVFLLNTRPLPDWIRSRLSHAGGEYGRLYMQYFGIRSEDELVSHWRIDWQRHLERVRDFFSHKGRLVEFNVQHDSPETLAKAIPELRLDPVNYVRDTAKAGNLVPKVQTAGNVQIESSTDVEPKNGGKF
jgi:hypothetical protein